MFSDSGVFLIHALPCWGLLSKITYLLVGIPRHHVPISPASKSIEYKMNFAASKPKKLDWKKIGFIALILAVVGYQYYQSNFAGPAVADQNQADEKSSDEKYKVDFKGGDSKKSGGYDVKFDPIKPSSGKSTGNSNRKSTGGLVGKANERSKPFLTSSGGKNYESPEGLVYGMGGGGEHRTDHVLRHAEDQPNRPSHGVFNAKGDDVFRLLDEAYTHVKSKSKQLKKAEESRGNMAYVIDMKRKIGFKGGQSGKRSGNPPLYKVKLIIAGKNRVITAYPY